MNDVDINKEFEHIMKGIKHADLILSEYQVRGLEELSFCYELLENALIGWEHSKTNGPPAVSDVFGKLEEQLEGRILKIALLLKVNGEKECTKRYINSPWEKKMTNFDYFRSYSSENVPIEKARFMYELLFDRNHNQK